MIINFQHDADYYVRMSEAAEDEGRMYDALRYMRRARELERSFAVYFAYARLLHDMQCYTLSCEACFELAKIPMSYDEKLEWYRLLTHNTHELNAMNAFLSYNADLLEMIIRDAGQDMLDLRADLEVKRALKNPFSWSDEEHDKHNQDLFDKATIALHNEDYAAVLDKIEGMQDGYSLYPQGLMIKAMALVEQGQTEQAREAFEQCFVKSGYVPEALAEWHRMLPLSPDEMRRQLALIPAQEQAVESLYAARCADDCRLYDVELQRCREAQELSPYDPQVLLTCAAACYNDGLADEAQDLIRQTIALHPFVPQCLLEMPLTDHITIRCRELPIEMVQWICEEWQRQTEHDGFVIAMLSDAEYRKQVRFILRYAAACPATQRQVLSYLAEWQSVESVEVAREALLFPFLDRAVVNSLVQLVLEQVRRGKLWVAQNCLLKSYVIKLPPSYDVTSAYMRQAYACAYCEMVCYGEKHENRLCRIMEKVLLTDTQTDWPAEYMGLAVWAIAGKTDRTELTLMAAERKWDITQLALCLDYVKAILDRPME